MSRTNQRLSVSPPSENDKDLKDHASVIQQNFEDIFEVSHSHDLKSGLPSTTDGVIGDIELIKDGSNFYLCAKFSEGWKKILLS